MKQKTAKIILFLMVFFAAGFFNTAHALFQVSQNFSGNNNVITTYTDKFYNSATLVPNTNVTLTFILQDKNDPNKTDVCGGGKNPYGYLKHWSGNNADYTAKGQGITFNANFNSGNAGQDNKYAGVFVCATDFISEPLAQNISNLESQGLGGEGKIFEIVTTAAVAQPQIIFNPPANGGFYTSGTTVNIDALNLPDGLGPVKCGPSANPNYKMKVSLNGQNTTFFCFPYPFTIKDGAIEGTIDMSGGTNNLEVIITDSSGNPISLQNSTLAFKVGQPSSNATSTATSTYGTGLGGNSSVTVFNPLPESDLTHVFLVVVQGFLGIIGIWAVMFIIVGGFQMVMAAGNEEMYTKAKKTIIWAVLGLAVALLSFSIIAIVQNLLQANTTPTTMIQEQQIKT